MQELTAWLDEAHKAAWVAIESATLCALLEGRPPPAAQAAAAPAAQSAPSAGTGQDLEVRVVLLLCPGIGWSDTGADAS